MFCGQDEFVFKQKLACVLQATLIELMVCEISLGKPSKSELTTAQWNALIMEVCEHKTCTDLCFEAKLIWFAPHNFKEKRFAADHKSLAFLLSFNSKIDYVRSDTLHMPCVTSPKLDKGKSARLSNYETWIKWLLKINRWLQRTQQSFLSSVN